MADEKDDAKKHEEPVEAIEHAIAEGPPPSAALPPPALPRQPWGQPLSRLDRAWTKLEARLCAWVLVAEIVSLCTWIFFKGMAAGYSPTSDDKSGLVLRALVGAVVFGLVAHRVLRAGAAPDASAALRQRYSLGVTGAVFAGLLVSRLWGNVGSSWFANLLNWMQTASMLTLVGGLRGVATRLTLWLALLGGSLATAQGKHINIDVVMRFLSPKLRVPVAVLGWIAAAVMCFAGVWGFLDHIAIESFRAPPALANAAAGEKLGFMAHEMRRDVFLFGRQVSLDLKTIPKVIGGTRYDQYLRTAEWNEWLTGADWSAYYQQSDVDALKLDPSQADVTHLPVISIPGSAENVPGLLVKDLNMVFPFGLLMIGLRFLLRCLLAIAGWARVDPDAAHGEEDVEDVQREKHGLTPAHGGDA